MNDLSSRRPGPARPVLALVLLFAALGCGAVPPREPRSLAGASGSTETPIKRTLLGSVPAGEEGWETRLYLIEYAPGAAAPPHVHPAPGVGWVIEGAFESAFGDEPITKVHAGEPFFDQAGARHTTFRNPDPRHPLRFVIAYTLRKGDEPMHLVP